MNRQTRILRCAAVLILLALACPASMATTGQATAAAVSLEQILKEISSYDGGIDSAPIWKLRDYIYSRKDDPAARAECEAKLLEYLQGNAPSLAKMGVCRHLRLIAGDRSVPVLQALLLGREFSDMALYALQKIPGSAADRALLDALSKTEGATRTSVIAALGDRKCVQAVAVLAPLLQSKGEFARAAAIALGQIGGDAAVRSLSAALPDSPPDLQAAVASAAMMAVEAFVAAQNMPAAAAIYDKVLSVKNLPASTREAAMIGKISTAGNQAAAILMSQLKSQDEPMQEAAIIKLRDIIKPDAIGPVCALLPGLGEKAQVQLIAALSQYPKERVLPPILKSAQSSSASVRIASFGALETAGDASAIPLLVNAAAKARGPEQIAARSAIGLIPGRAPDEALLALLGTKPAPDIQAEILQALGERRMFAAKGVVAEFLSAPASGVRIQALRTLRTIGTPSDMPAVLDFILTSPDDLEQSEGTTTATALAQKISGTVNRAGAVRDLLATTKEPRSRARLYPILGRIGDDASLATLRSALSEANGEAVDAAVRALCAWPTAAARDDVVDLAQKAGNETHRLLALQGFLRMIRLERNRKPEAAVADLRLAYAISTRPDERRLILGALPNFACPEALALAGILLGDPTVEAEARTAIDRIKTRLSVK
jgi:HEAT repeat protein